MMKIQPIYMHTLKDGADLGGAGAGAGNAGFEPTPGDRGDEIVERGEPEPNAEEAALAKATKEAADKKVAKEKEEADEKAAADKAAADAAKKKAEKKEGDEEEEEDPEKKGKKDTRIPLARHKALLEAERTEKERLIAALAQYQNGETLAKTNEAIQAKEDQIIKLEGEYNKAIVDGKNEDATKLMRQIRTLDREVSQMQTKLATDAAESRSYERARYDIAVERIEEAYPVLNPDHDDFDETKVKKITTIARAYQIDGMTPAKALQEAVKDLLGEPKNKAQEQATTVTPRVDEAAAAKAAREEAARAKAAEAAGKQPPSSKDVGKDADKLGGSGTLSATDVMKMNFNDFSKLDETTLARLRGDAMQ